MVAANEWRDYAIDHLSDRAVFSVFRRTSETPLFQIVKDPKLARKQGAYSVVAASGLILKRGQELAQRARRLRQDAEAGRGVERYTPLRSGCAKAPFRQRGRIRRRLSCRHSAASCMNTVSSQRPCL